jgi:hypothetical protein
VKVIWYALIGLLGLLMGDFIFFLANGSSIFCSALIIATTTLVKVFSTLIWRF